MQLNDEQIEQILARVPVASIATINRDGTPYVIPIHFAYKDGVIYFHGSLNGQKIENIKLNERVCLTIYEMDSLIVRNENNPCNVNTKYQSVIVRGSARILEDYDEKCAGLKYIVEKYVPNLKQKDMPESAVHATAVIAVECSEITGKYYE